MHSLTRDDQAEALGAAPPTSSGRHAHAAPDANDLADFEALTQLVWEAVDKSRLERVAEFAAVAAQNALVLFGQHSLVAASLLHLEVEAVGSLYNRELAAGRNSGGSDSTAHFSRRLMMRALNVMSRMHAIVLARIRDDTLWPERVTAEEVDYWLRQAQPGLRADDVARRLAYGSGYRTASRAASQALNFVRALDSSPPALAGERPPLQRFVLRYAQLLPAVAALDAAHAQWAREEMWRTLGSERPEGGFYASLRAALRAPHEAQGATHGRQAPAPQPAQPLPGRLRACALPSCGAREAAPNSFQRCSGCAGATAYCGPEHQKAHWKAHRRGCS